MSIRDQWCNKPSIEAYNVPPANSYMVGGSHYKQTSIEPWDVADTWPREQQIGVYRHGALKYIMRMGTKDEEAQEIEKAIHYLQKLLEVLKPPQKEGFSGCWAENPTHNNK